MASFLVKKLFGGERVNLHTSLRGGGHRCGHRPRQRDHFGLQIGSHLQSHMRVHAEGSRVDRLLAAQSGKAVLGAIPELQIEGVGIQLSKRADPPTSAQWLLALLM